jgi:ubiquitin-conjugating enzyme E2 S
MDGTNENVSPQVIRQVAKEMGKLMGSPAEDIKVHMNEADLTDIQATITGPAGTPYEGGKFRVKIVLGESYPSAPPKGFFVTKIFHPNVAKTGAICVNTLKKDWKKEYGIAHVLQVIKCLLIYPNPASALNEEAGDTLCLTSVPEFRCAVSFFQIDFPTPITYFHHDLMPLDSLLLCNIRAING